MAALISSVMNTKDRVLFYVNACDELGIEVLPLDVNSSQTDFAVVEGKIRFGLTAVKNVGDSAARAIVSARDEGGPFASIWDFTERVDPQVVNKRALESLVKCGALDSTGAAGSACSPCSSRRSIWVPACARTGCSVQASIFDGLVDETEVAPQRHHPPLPSGEFEKQELLRLEKETSGSTSRSTRCRACASSCVGRRTRHSRSSSAAATVRSSPSAGSSQEVKQVTTKRGEPMVFLTLDDPTGTAEAVVFNSTYAAARDLCVADRSSSSRGASTTSRPARRS